MRVKQYFVFLVPATGPAQVYATAPTVALALKNAKTLLQQGYNVKIEAVSMIDDR